MASAFSDMTCLIPSGDGSGLESAFLNQWPLKKKASQMINSILNTLPSCPTEEKKSEEKGRGRENQNRYVFLLLF